MVELSEQLNMMMQARQPVRFHTIPVLRPQSIDAHSWGVAMLVYLLYGQEEPGIRTQLLMAALCHDMAEYKFGDLPAPAKRTMGERITLGNGGTFKQAWDEMEEAHLKQFGLDWDVTLDDEERRKLKFCDALDGILYVIRERATGNTAIQECWINFRRYLRELNPGDTMLATEADALMYIDHAWSLANGNR